jgi:hypothetical protein
VARCWSEVFRRGGWGPAVFEVLPGHRAAVRIWAQHQNVPTASQHELHVPDVDAWAVLDGGVTSIRGYGLTSLSCGVRVVGFQAFRLLLTEFGLAGPVLPFPGEVVLTSDVLHRRHRSDAARGDAAIEQAELLASCSDAVLMRWVAATLLADTPSAKSALTAS